MDIEEKFNKILNTLEEVKDRLSKIEEKMGIVTRHVDFIEDIYVKVKSPLDFICSKFSTKSQVSNIQRDKIEN